MKHFSAGKLFLGTSENTPNYSYKHSAPTQEIYKEGYSFTSRPSALRFSYTYKSVNGDYAFVKIEVLDVDNNSIGHGEVRFGNQEKLTIASVPVKYTNTLTKAAKLKIMFASSSSCSYDQSEEDKNIKQFTEDNKAEAIRTGSEFFIADVTLFYE